MSLFKSRHLSLATALTGAGAILLIAFQNCAPSRHADAGAENVSTGATVLPVDDAPVAFSDELEAASAPFKTGKVQLRATPSDAKGVSGKTSRALLPAGSRFVVILDNECARQTPGDISRTVYDPARELSGLKTQSYLWVLSEDTEIPALQALSEADPCLIGLSPDDLIKATAAPNDPKLSSQWNFLSTGGDRSHGFFKDALRGAVAEVVVAVVDSGVAFNHEDLKDSLWKEGDIVGYNIRMNSTAVFDDFGHGTLVSGIIGAKSDNGLGISGVMGHNLKLLTLKVQDSLGNALISDISRAIDTARAKSVDVINISMEGVGDQPALLSALNSAVTAGAFIAVAAGNSALSISSADTGSSAYVIPAVYSASVNGMMTVGSIDSVTGARSSFSNYNPDFVEIAAPGSNGIYSTDRNGSYSNTQGTSFSAPMVAGAAALVISFFKQNGIAYTPATVESTIAAAAVRKSALTGSFAQGRVLNLKALAEYLRRTYLTPVDGGFNEN